MHDRIDVFQNALAQIESAIAQIRRELGLIESGGPKPASGESNVPDELATQGQPSDILSPQQNLAIYQVTSASPLSRPEQVVLSAIARLEQARPLEMNCTLIAALAGYAPSERSFQEALDSLAKQELVKRTLQTAALTERGSELVESESQPLTSEMLAERVAAQLTQHQATLFLFLFEMRGAGVGQREIIQECGIGKNQKAFQKELSTLQSLSLVRRVTSKTYACAEVLFLD